MYGRKDVEVDPEGGQRKGMFDRASSSEEGVGTMK